MLAWRNYFNKGDLQYFGDTYLEEASLYANLGPPDSLAFFKVRLNLESPLILRGQDVITNFWRNLYSKVGVRHLRILEDGESFQPQILVVNDDEVVVSCSFEVNAFQGQMLSQTWVRVSSDRWKIKNHMFAIDAIDLKALEARANKTVDAKVVVEEKVETQKVKTQKFLDDAHKEQKDMVEMLPIGQSSIEKKPSSHFFWFLLVALSILAAAILYFKHQREKYSFSTIGGPDSMLG